ncbi:hypothetical protein [Cytobacillus massiliigabonensis]|uniref:hypothetical protein n=1 Tax=Cytobacillus massiliigabonensis TaxID=1871011 RepID=UPI000C825DBD|nr:hypothetical protein [Cytobacillus massiliigabonensis]
MSIIYIIIILTTLYLASKKNRNPIFWLIGSILLPPAAIIAILIVKPLPKIANNDLSANSVINQDTTNKFDKYTINSKWFKQYKSPLSVIVLTGIFALTGYVYEYFYLSFLSHFDNNNIDKVVKLLLINQLRGDTLTLESITAVANSLHYNSTSLGNALEEIFMKNSFKNALLFGFIGLILSLLIISKDIAKKISESRQTNFSKFLKFISDRRKGIVLSLVSIWLTGYLFGMGGYYFKQFYVNLDKAEYYHELFKEQYGEDQYPEIKPYVSSFLEGEYYIVDGATLYEAELTKDKTKKFGYILGIILVLYRNRSRLASIMNKNEKFSRAS